MLIAILNCCTKEELEEEDDDETPMAITPETPEPVDCEFLPDIRESNLVNRSQWRKDRMKDGKSSKTRFWRSAVCLGFSHYCGR